MIMVAVFFLVMAGVNFGIHKMHLGKAQEIRDARAGLTAPEDIEKNEKALKARESAVKSTKFATGFLGFAAAACLMMALFM